MYKLGLDIHGVIDKHYDMILNEMIPVLKYFDDLEIHIITGSSLTQDIVSELMKYNGDKIWWDHFFSINDYLLQKGLPHTFNKYNRPIFDDKEWDRAKGDYCFRNNIDFMLDDTKRYEKYFKTKFMLIEDFIKILDNI